MRAWIGLLLLAAAPAFGQTVAPPGIPASQFPKPSRPVASIISDRWSNEDTREHAGEAASVLQLLDIRPGMTVADIGAGSGYYTVRLSRRVGASGHVFAEDIMPDYLAGLQRRVATERLANVTLALGEAHDPRLPPASTDVALLVHMYHEIDQPFGLLVNLLPALRPSARVAILDADRPTLQHGTPPALLQCELRAVGYRQVGFHPLENGATYLAVFTPPAQPPKPDSIVPCQSEAAR
jgi:SAM-dependent methyltransferase